MEVALCRAVGFDSAPHGHESDKTEESLCKYSTGLTLFGIVRNFLSVELLLLQARWQGHLGGNALP